MRFDLSVSFSGSSRCVPLDTGSRWRIGRWHSCEIHVTDQYISAEHAELLLSGSCLTLRNIGGSNPILIDGKPVQSTQLKDGSRFTIGETEFALHACMPINAADETTLNRIRAALPGTHTTRIDARAVLAGKTDTLSIAPSPTLVSIPSLVSAHLLAQVFAMLRKASDRQALAQAVLDLACQRLGAARAFLARIEPVERIDIFSAKGFPADARIAELVSTSVMKGILETQQAVIIADTTAPGSEIAGYESVLKNNIRAVACTPIFNSHGKIDALLYMDNQNRHEEFSTADAEFLIWLGHIYVVLSENLEMRRRLEAELVTLKSAGGQTQMVAEAPTMIQLLERVKKAAASEVAVLVLGESGVGKERIARLCHSQSSRASGPFRGINCGAIPETLFESEMFGHKKGAFTGAGSDHLGIFREADGGTIFLDEIGDLDYEMQKKLLRVIEEGYLRPVGGDKDVPVNVRLVCATNKDLAEAIRGKSFREDLYFRISTVTLKVPPLRERNEDIIPLAKHFARQCSDGVRSLSGTAEKRLLTYDWPGNVRELRAVIQQAVIYAAGTEIQADELDLPSSSAGRINLGPKSLLEAERRHILQILQDVGGNKTEAAKVLGLSRSTLVLKLKSYNRDNG